MRSRGYGAVFLLVLPLFLGAAGAFAEDISGTYRHRDNILATIMVRAQTDNFLVRLEGGASAAGGAATPADCVIEAKGSLKGSVLRARFGPVETGTFSYGAAQSEREGRVVEIVFQTGSARVVYADTLGYCGLGVDFAGSYNKVEESTGKPSAVPMSATMFLQAMLKSAGGDEKRLKEIQEKIESEMRKQDVPTDISVSDFVSRPDPQLEHKRQAVAKELGWTP